MTPPRMAARTTGTTGTKDAEHDPATGLIAVLDQATRRGKIPTGHEEEKLLGMHRWMVFARVFDDRMMSLQRAGRIGFYGETRGQEAAIVGCGTPLAREDWVFPALREGLIMLMRGYPLAKYIASNYGNALDNMKGRQMPCHYSAREVRQVSWSSSMATQLPHAAGAAYAAKLKGTREVFVGFVGDGGTSENDFHAALNFAGVHRTPNVFVVQNNQWAISVPGRLQTASASYAVKAHAYGFGGVRVDGNDVLAVEETMRAALERARRGDGPTLIECVTFRMGGHSTSDDPTRYRADDELEAWRERDPIARFEAFLARVGLVDEAAAQAVRREALEAINKAIEEVESASPPAADTLFEDVFADLPAPLAAQRAEMQRLIEGYGAPGEHA